MLYIYDTLRRSVLRFAAMVLLLAVTSPLCAQNTWLFQISEKEAHLANPFDPMAMKANMWDVPYQRMNERNMPTVEITNLQSVGGPDIVEVRMTIGDTRFHFADDYFSTFALLGSTTPGYQLTSTTADNGNELIVNISKNGGGGLKPGEVVRFRIDIDVDPGYPDPPFFVHPDYRTVLFDMNHINYYGVAPPGVVDENAKVTVKFSDNTTSQGSFDDCERVGGGTCWNVPAPQSSYYNNIYRPYGVMEPVDIFRFGSGSTPVIPEPSSALLAIFCLIGGSWLTGRRLRG